MASGWTECPTKGTLSTRDGVCMRAGGEVAFFFTYGYIDCARCEVAPNDDL